MARYILEIIQDSAVGMKSWFVDHRLEAKDRGIDLFDATPSRANFLMAVAFSKTVLKLTRAKNKRTQLCLQIE